MKVNKIFLWAVLSISLTSCADLFDPAQENNRGLDEIYNEPTYAQGLLGYGYAMLPYNTKSVTDVATDDAVSNDQSNSYLKMATGSWAANNDPMSQWTNRRAKSFVYFFPKCSISSFRMSIKLIGQRMSWLERCIVIVVKVRLMRCGHSIFIIY